MELWQKQGIISRIVAGETQIKLNIDGEPCIFCVRSPSVIWQMYAEEIYQQVRETSEWHGVPTSDDMITFLQTNGLWTVEDQRILDGIEKDVENLKVGLFENMLNTKIQQQTRSLLQNAKEERERLILRKHGYDSFTCEGIASSAKLRFLLGSSIFINGEAYWDGAECWNEPDNILDKVFSELVAKRISEENFREISRSEPWSTTWATAKHAGRELFDRSAVDLTDDQRSLIVWSGVYESIRNHSECPANEVFEDDDLLDGWMIIQRRKRDSELNKRQGDNIVGNEKIRNAPEQFLVTSPDKVGQVIGMNDREGLMNFKQRMKTIENAKGEDVPESAMPDTQRDIRQNLVEQFVNRSKNK